MDWNWAEMEWGGGVSCSGLLTGTRNSGRNGTELITMPPCLNLIRKCFNFISTPNHWILATSFLIRR
jgi:hypothetical protein